MESKNNIIENRQVKIAFVGLYNEKNYGDPIIIDSTEWLYKQHIQSKGFCSERLYLDYIQKTYRPKFIKRVRNKLARCLNISLNNDDYERDLLDKTQEYFESSLVDFDLAVVVGGGIIKWSYQYFHVGLTALLQAAEKLNVPVVFNAVGVEGYSSIDSKCQLLKNAMHLPALIHISTRDDLQTLVENYYDNNPQRPILQVADPACWVSEAYGIKRNPASQVIGVGIARGGIFIDNGIDISPNEMENIYANIVTTLIAKGHEVEIFTNGLPADNSFADIVCQRLSQENIYVKHRYPSSPKDLVRIIASYKAIIATRLHSCIIAYSLEVPAVGLVWNDKLSFFGHNIHKEERFVKPQDFNANHIVEMVEKAAKEGYDENLRKSFRQTIVNDIMDIDKKTLQIAKCKHLLTGGGKYDLFVYKIY